jgi:hypothetical protein
MRAVESVRNARLQVIKAKHAAFLDKIIQKLERKINIMLDFHAHELRRIIELTETSTIDTLNNKVLIRQSLFNHGHNDIQLQIRKFDCAIS